MVGPLPASCDASIGKMWSNSKATGAGEVLKKISFVTVSGGLVADISLSQTHIFLSSFAAYMNFCSISWSAQIYMTYPFMDEPIALQR